MKKTPLIIILIPAIIGCAITAFAQDQHSSAPTGYKSVLHETLGKLRFDLYCKIGSWGFGQQFYPANFYNGTFYDIHVKGEYVAKLTCGNEAVSRLDFTCKKYAEIINVDPNEQGFPYTIPHHYISDITGLVAVADEKLCAGTNITAAISSKGGKIRTADRITALQIRNLKLYAIQADGSEVPITDEGVMINPPPSSPEVQNVDNSVNKRAAVNLQIARTSPEAGSIAGVDSRQQQQQTVYRQRQQTTTTAPPQQQTYQALQQRIYQQQANSYLAAASTSSDPIQQSLNINLAKINAMAAGNNSQTQQLRQMQQTQQQNTSNALTDAMGQLATLLIKPKPAPQSTVNSEEDLKTRIRKEYEAEGVVFDPNGNVVSTPESRDRNAYDQVHTGESQESLNNLGIYSQPIHIDMTADLLKTQDNRSQKETVDFLAQTIWQYSKTTGFRPHIFIGNIIDEIAFADSVFYYKCHNGVEDNPNIRYPKEFKLNFNQTRVTSFETLPGDKVSHDDIYLFVKTSDPKESLEFHLTADAASKNIPIQIIGAFIHLIILCHGPAPAY